MGSIIGQGQLIASIAAPLAVALLCLYARHRQLGGTYLLLWAAGQGALSLTFLMVALAPAIGDPADLPAAWRLALLFWHINTLSILVGVITIDSTRLSSSRGLAIIGAGALLMTGAGAIGRDILWYGVLPLQSLLAFASAVLLLWRPRSIVYVVAGLVQLLRTVNGVLYVHAVHLDGQMLLPDYTSALSVFFNFLAGISLLAIAVENSWRKLRAALDEARISETVLNLAPVYIVRKDRNLRTIYANGFAIDHARRFGLNHEFHIGARSSDIMPPDGALQMEGMDQALLAQPWLGVIEREVSYRLPDGSQATHLVRKAAATNEAGEAVGIVSATLDITRLKEIEGELRRQIGRTEAASQAKSNFLAHMSHELRTPLNGISGFAELLAAGFAGPLTEKQQAYLDDILTASRHMLALVSDILALSERESDAATPPQDPVDLGEIAAAAAAAAEPLAIGRGVTLSVQVPSLTVTADREALLRILSNLISNAIRFNRRDGHVSLVLAAVDGRPALQVADTGAGMTAEQIAAAREALPSGDPRRARPGGGAGLGLAVTSALVTRLGGRLRISSVAGEGTTVTVIL